MNGIRVIRTIAFDISAGDEVVADGLTFIVRGFDIERRTVTADLLPNIDEMERLELNGISKRVITKQYPVEKIVGNNRVVVIRDRLLKIGDIPHGQPINSPK